MSLKSAWCKLVGHSWTFAVFHDEKQTLRYCINCGQANMLDKGKWFTCTTTRNTLVNDGKHDV